MMKYALISFVLVALSGKGMAQTAAPSLAEIDSFLNDHHQVRTSAETEYVLFIVDNYCAGVVEELMQSIKKHKVPKNAIAVFSTNYTKNNDVIKQVLAENKNAYWDNKNAVARSRLRITGPTLVLVKNGQAEVILITAQNLNEVKSLFNWK